jgi:hypothetical protein
MGPSTLHRHSLANDDAALRMTTKKNWRALLAWAAGGGCPHVSLEGYDYYGSGEYGQGGRQGD